MRYQIVGAVLAAFLALSGAAEARPVNLTYVGYMGGLPVFALNAKIEVPAGAGQGAYRIDANAQTTGSFAVLYPYRSAVSAVGQLGAGAARPSQFVSVAEVYGRRERVSLTYGGGGEVAIAAEPLTRQAQEAAAGGYARGTIDPASAVAALVGAFANQQKCGGNFRIFDGVRRYDLDFGDAGVVDLSRFPKSYYDGTARECRAVPRLGQGFQNSAVASQFYPTSARLWLAEAVSGLPAIPVRIEAQNALGPMLLDLVAVQ